jgi:hypothetical protein
MKMLEATLVMLVLLLALGAGCNADPDKSSNQSDAGSRVLRAECDAPATECHRGCLKRGEGDACGSCCFGQMIMCNDGDKYSFDSCVGTDPGTRTR